MSCAGTRAKIMVELQDVACGNTELLGFSGSAPSVLASGDLSVMPFAWSVKITTTSVIYSYTSPGGWKHLGAYFP